VNIDLSFNQLVLAAWKNGPSHYAIISFQSPLDFFSNQLCSIMVVTNVLALENFAVGRD
jgi:hypothetical protein